MKFMFLILSVLGMVSCGHGSSLSSASSSTSISDFSNLPVGSVIRPINSILIGANESTTYLVQEAVFGGYRGNRSGRCQGIVLFFKHSSANVDRVILPNQKLSVVESGLRMYKFFYYAFFDDKMELGQIDLETDRGFRFSLVGTRLVPVEGGCEARPVTTTELSKYFEIERALPQQL